MILRFVWIEVLLGWAVWGYTRDGMFEVWGI